MAKNEKKWGLGLVANPYSTVCLVELDGDQPAWRNVKKWTGKWDYNSKPIYRGSIAVVTTHDVHTSGGAYDAGSVEMVDATPRTYEEACAIAARCAPGNHLSHLTRKSAAVMISDIVSGGVLAK